jgi:hypothetical protein
MQSVTTDPGVVSKILRHLKLPTGPPPLAPARSMNEPDGDQDPELFDDAIWQQHGEQSGQHVSDAEARAPPRTRWF